MGQDPIPKTKQNKNQESDPNRAHLKLYYYFSPVLIFKIHNQNLLQPSPSINFFWRVLFISSCILETLVTMGGLPLKGSSSTVATAESQPNQGSAITTSVPESKPKKKICCACPETKKLRDECIVENGEESCAKWIEAHRKCLRAEGFNV
ncbi:hypothetical protein Q3G72_018454 [Acer saccharum]|nr:hypothetical protein Q3G72_018454 [Acer saccharum]